MGYLSPARPTHPPPLQTSLPLPLSKTYLPRLLLSPLLPLRPLQNPFYEVWDPAHASKPTLVFQLSSAFTKNTKYFYYPFNFVLPTGRCKLRAGCYAHVCPSSTAFPLSNALPASPLPYPLH